VTYVVDRFQSDRLGKPAVMAQLAIHWAEAATPRAARMRLGNISPRKTQTTTPHERAENRTKVWAPMSATVPSVFGRVRLPPVPVLWEKAQATRPWEIAMPAEPTRARGLRPTRSTKSIAITVPMMLMIDVVKEFRHTMLELDL